MYKFMMLKFLTPDYSTQIRCCWRAKF